MRVLGLLMLIKAFFILTKIQKIIYLLMLDLRLTGHHMLIQAVFIHTKMQEITPHGRYEGARSPHADPGFL